MIEISRAGSRFVLQNLKLISTIIAESSYPGGG